MRRWFRNLPPADTNDKEQRKTEIKYD